MMPVASMIPFYTLWLLCEDTHNARLYHSVWPPFLQDSIAVQPRTMHGLPFCNSNEKEKKKLVALACMVLYEIARHQATPKCL